MKTLYVTDLDGTLLNAHSRISQYSLDVINSLVEQGMLFTYATARSIVSASVVAEGLSARTPVITYNGQRIVCPATGETLASVGFTLEEMERGREILEQCEISPLVHAYINGIEKASWDISRENEWLKSYREERGDDPRFRLLEDENGLYDGEIFYFTCTGSREEMLPAYEMFQKDDRFTCTFSRELYRPEYLFEVMPQKATKAHAILTLKELWNCGRVVSFGDAMNDIPMFRISDECYAVSNAVPELKTLATGIIGSNEEDGVAKWLLEHANI